MVVLEIPEGIEQKIERTKFKKLYMHKIKQSKNRNIEIMVAF